MFELLKKKLASWLGKPAKKTAKRTKIREKVEGKTAGFASKEKQKKAAKRTKTKKQKKQQSAKKPQKIAKPAKLTPQQEQEVIKTLPLPIEEELEVPKPSQEQEESEKPAQKTEESVKESEEPKKEGFLAKLFKKFKNQKLTEEQFNEIFTELEIILFENNVAFEVVEKIKENLSKDMIGMEIQRADIEKKITESLKKAILDVLIEPPNLLKQIEDKKGVFTIIFFGINGSGKTTSIAKVAHMLKKAGISCVLAAADTFRAASIEQLQKHGENLGIKVIAYQYGSDPAAVAFDAKKYAETNNIKVVLIDTAGRMYTKQNLLKEMEKIIRISQPDLKIFVGESITGNDATEQARTFNETAGIDGIVLSKADVDEKAGTILSVSHVTKKPIYFLGTGQNYDDLTPFTKHTVLKNLGL